MENEIFRKIVYLTAMLRYSLVLTAIGVLSVFINLAMSRFISKKRIDITRIQLKDSGKLSGMTVSGIEMIKSIKANARKMDFLKNGQVTRQEPLQGRS